VVQEHGSGTRGLEHVVQERVVGPQSLSGSFADRTSSRFRLLSLQDISHAILLPMLARFTNFTAQQVGGRQGAVVSLSVTVAVYSYLALKASRNAPLALVLTTCSAAATLAFAPSHLASPRVASHVCLGSRYGIAPCVLLQPARAIAVVSGARKNAPKT
jgi:hypothetical protein